MRLLARAEKADAVEDQAGLLPVHVAASAGQAPMVAYLAARAGVEVASRQGLSPLMCAAYRWAILNCLKVLIWFLKEREQHESENAGWYGG